MPRLDGLDVLPRLAPLCSAGATDRKRGGTAGLAEMDDVSEGR